MHIAAVTSLALGAFASTALAQTTLEIPAAPLNTEFFLGSEFIGNGAGAAADGLEIIDARVRFSITVDPLPPGSGLLNGAEFFSASVILPIDTDPVAPGVQAFQSVISGADLGWSGTGTFDVDLPIPEAIGSTWVAPFFFTAETFGGDNGATSTVNLAEPINANLMNLVVDDGWFITVVPAPGAAGLFMAAGFGVLRRKR